MVTLRSGRHTTSTSHTTIKPENQPNASIEISQLATKRRHDTDIVARNANIRLKPNSPQTRFGLGKFAAFEPETPLVLSPTSTASTVSSPGDVNDVWDSPDGTREHSNETLKSEASSPMTPPTVYNIQDKRNPMPKEFNVVQASIVKTVARTHIAMQLSTRATRIEDEQPEQLPAEDYFFKPKKLFRNLTKVFQASKAYDLILPR
jgi:hypothetical protein